MKKILIIASLLMLTGIGMQAKVTLPSVISDNMVLQQQTEAAIWGTTDSGKKVTVTTGWDGAAYTARPDKSGKWLLRVKTPAAGGPYTITISDGETLTLNNVLIGEVWFCSGQSNMEMPVKGYMSQPAKGAAEVLANAKASRQLRICNIRQKSSTTVLETTEGSWCENTPENVAVTSATAYFFADALQKAIDVPVGILVTSWGGSSIETWMTRELIAAEFPELELGHLDGSKPVKIENQDPCLLFNGQVAPLIPFTFKGMIWYQGETNRGRNEQYTRLQTAYVKMMRELFCVPEAPFYFVQIAPFNYDNPRKFESGYFCEAQANSLKTIPHSGMAVTCDTGEQFCIHPCEKQVVGKRLAYLALTHDYGNKAIAADAPTYEKMEVKEGKAYLTFTADEMGLAPLGADLTGFEIAGSDRVFKPATGRILWGKLVVVSSEEVPEPAAVRYCFRNWCKGNLYNNYGIPAGPFRTDGWDDLAE